MFGILEWKVEERTTSANFVDLTISINKDSKIENRPYQKAMNLYLYLPPTSAHPLNVIRGMICGMLRKYDEKNSHRKHNIKMSVLLLWRLATGEWGTTLLQRIFNEASVKVEKKCPSKTQERKVNPVKRQNEFLFTHNTILMAFHENKSDYTIKKHVTTHSKIW